MMLSRVESRTNEDPGNSSSRRFLHDIEQVSKHLNLHRKSLDYVNAPTHRRSKSNDITRDLLHKEKKPSIWKKSLKALSHIRNRRFDCWFFLHVHLIEGLPSEFDDTHICVYWTRKHEEMITRPAKISQGKAQFEETLMHRCSVYGSKNGQHNLAKYEPKIYLLYPLVVEASMADMGKNRIDLTKLLPFTLEELEDKKNSGKWTSSFKLSGRAKGGMLHVSFGFSLRHNHSSELGNKLIIPKLLRESKLYVKGDDVDPARVSGREELERVGSSASNSKRFILIKSQSLDNNFLMENIVKVDRSHKTSREHVENDRADGTFVVAEQGLEKSIMVGLISEGADHVSTTENVDVKEIFEDDGMTVGEEKDCDLRDEDYCEDKDYDITGDSKHDGKDTEDNDEWMGFNPISEGYCNKDGYHVTGLIKYDGNDTPNNVVVLENSKIEIIDTKELFKDDDTDVNGKLVFDSTEDIYSKNDCSILGNTKSVENDASIEGLMLGKFNKLKTSVTVSGDLKYMMNNNEHDIDTDVTDMPRNIARSLRLDNITESVANDFLKGLDIENVDSDPESPRGLLLRQFEEEALALGDFILDDDSEEENVSIGGDDSKLSLVIRVDKHEDGINKFAQSLRIKKDAELLEYTETKALMKEWGFNENVFQNSPTGSSCGGFGSPVYLPTEETVEYPPLGEGLESTIRTTDGGFLRSMNPLLFKNGKNGGKLIMQISAPVVLPAEMGSSIMEILELWASVGCEKMHMQLDELFPLEDISGKMLQQVAWENTSRIESTESERSPSLQRNSEDWNNCINLKDKVKDSPFSWPYEDVPSTSFCDGIDIDYVSFEGLAPLAMDKIETMSIEGLKIQSGVLDEEAPSIIKPQLFGVNSAYLGKSVMAHGSPVLEGIDESQAKNRVDDLDELLSLSLKLDEWMRIDAGVFDGEDEMSERISKIMEAHFTGNVELDSPTLIQDRSTGNCCGLLGNNFTVALRVQLRDPLRDYEIVGSSMISLVEVERVFLDPKPIIHCRASDGDDDEEHYATFDQARKETHFEEEQNILEEATPLFKINEVHVVGFSMEATKKQSHNISQEHSGLRWLLSSGMVQMKNFIHLKTNAIVKQSYSQGSISTRDTDTLWSISSHVHSQEAKWKELATLNVHIRNPDVVFLD